MSKLVGIKIIARLVIAFKVNLFRRRPDAQIQVATEFYFHLF